MPATKRRTGQIFYLHFHEAEAQEQVAPLRALGHEVQLHWSTETTPRLKDNLPEVFVISLDRLPSHGRTYAGWFWEAKKRQSIPLIFVGGQPDKVALARTQFPRALFCKHDELPAVIDEALGPSTDKKS